MVNQLLEHEWWVMTGVPDLARGEPITQCSMIQCLTPTTTTGGGRLWNKKAMGFDRSTDLKKIKSKCWPKVVKITLGSNYAKNNLGVGHMQPNKYHHIPTYVSTK